MTAHDALTRITQVLDSQTCAEDPRHALYEIRCLIEDCEPQPFTAALPTQPGWYVFDSADGRPKRVVFVYQEHGKLWVKEWYARALADMDGVGQWKGPLDLEAL